MPISPLPSMLIINYLLLIFKHLFKNKFVSHIGSLDHSSRAHASLSLEIRNMDFPFFYLFLLFQRPEGRKEKFYVSNYSSHGKGYQRSRHVAGEEQRYGVIALICRDVLRPPG